MRAVDVTALLVAHLRKSTAMELQKLLYYCQGVHLVLHGTPLFSEQIEAWKDGPVVPQVYAHHRGKRHIVHPWPSDCVYQSAMLNATRDASAVIVTVASALQSMTGDELADSTHRESPWQDARGSLPSWQRSCNIIDSEAITKHFTRILDLEMHSGGRSEAEKLLCLEVSTSRDADAMRIKTAEQLVAWNELFDSSTAEVEGLAEFLRRPSVCFNS